MMANPEVRAMIEANPEMGHALQDPEHLRQTMRMARDPRLRQEFARIHDRQMANVNAIPGGFNHLQRLHQQMEGPLRDAADRDPTQRPPARGGASTATAAAAASPSNDPAVTAAEDKENPFIVCLQLATPEHAWIHPSLTSHRSVFGAGVASATDDVSRTAKHPACTQPVGDTRATNPARCWGCWWQPVCIAVWPWCGRGGRGAGRRRRRRGWRSGRHAVWRDAWNGNARDGDAWNGNAAGCDTNGGALTSTRWSCRAPAHSNPRGAQQVEQLITMMESNPAMAEMMQQMFSVSVPA